MRDERMCLWVLDTISEGGYSFKEICDYVHRHNIAEIDLQDMLDYLVNIDYIAIIITLNSGGKYTMDKDKSKKCIANIDQVMKEELLSKVSYYLKILPQGINILKGNGIT